MSVNTGPGRRWVGNDGDRLRAAYRLFRVDDRLLHGQVTLGWGRWLSPRSYVIADDRLAEDSDAVELYVMAAPEGTIVRVAPLEDLLSTSTDLPDPAATILLVRGVNEAARLLRGGVPGPLNLGGLHARPGASPVLSYLFLTPEDARILRDLQREGHTIFAQDLPQNPRLDRGEWGP